MFRADLNGPKLFSKPIFYKLNLYTFYVKHPISRISSIKSPESGACKVGRLDCCHKSGKCAKSCARKSVYLCSQNGGGARIGLLT
jgi:hypothetical protein